MVSRLFSIIAVVFFFGLNCMFTTSTFAMETEQGNDEVVEESNILNTEDSNGDSEDTTEADRQGDNENVVVEEVDDNKN